MRNLVTKYVAKLFLRKLSCGKYKRGSEYSDYKRRRRAFPYPSDNFFPGIIGKLRARYDNRTFTQFYHQSYIT